MAASYGSGRNLEITLLADEDRPRRWQGEPQDRGDRSSEVRQLDRLHFHPGRLPQALEAGCNR